jgi:hypothetical protein
VVQRTLPFQLGRLGAQCSKAAVRTPVMTINGETVVWLVLRIGRGASWVGFFADSVAVVLDRPSYLDRFGHLLL